MHLLYEQWSPFTTSGRLIKPLRKLAVIVGIDPDLPPEKIAQAFADRYITVGVDRWHEPPVILNPWQEQLIRQYLREAGMIQEVEPEFDGVRPAELDDVLNLGGILPGCYQKVDKIDRVGEDVQIGRVIHLGSGRGLELYELEALLSMGAGIDCLTESDMLEFLVEKFPWRESLGRAGMHNFVRAPKTTGHRAHTGDTIREYVRLYRPARNARLGVTSLQPHVEFQASVVARYLQGLRPDLQITMMAPSADLGPQEMNFYLGAVARWLLRWVEARAELGRPIF